MSSTCFDIFCVLSPWVTQWNDVCAVRALIVARDQAFRAELCQCCLLARGEIGHATDDLDCLVRRCVCVALFGGWYGDQVLPGPTGAIGGLAFFLGEQDETTIDRPVEALPRSLSAAAWQLLQHAVS